MKKLVLTFLLGMGMVFTTVLGYAAINYILNKTITETITVGDTIQYSDGIIIELSDYDDYNLIYLDLDETDTSKHYLTYIYDYTILVENMALEVSSLSDEIIINCIEIDETQVAITFSLNNELEFNSGDILNIQFYFEAVEISLGSFNASNPININNATNDQLIDIGLTSFEVSMTIDARNVYTLTSVSDWETRTSLSGIVLRYQEYEDLGIIVFE